jgi:hypothetical protein
MLKKIFLSGIFGIVAAGAAFAQSSWQEEKGDHFIVYYQSDEASAREVLRKAESCYVRVADDLGYARHSNFWSWDKRVKIWLHPSREAFLAATGQPAWSVGNARYDTKEISGFVGSAGFVDDTLPHEIAHLVFRDYVGFTGIVPLWLDEGVAQWQEPAKRKVVDYYVKDLERRHQLMRLRDLTRMNMGYLQGGDAARTFYIQAAALVSFMIKKYGADEFIHFCRQLRDGKSLDEALGFAHGAMLTGLDDLEAAFLKYVGELRFDDSRAEVAGGVTTVVVRQVKN